MTGMRRSKGFTLFEAIVAIFILLVGVMGIASVFSAGLRARMVAQELIISQELANMWADWVRFRLNAEGLAAGNTLGLADLAAGKQGDFHADTGDFHDTAGSVMNLPTYDRNVYDGYTWEIAKVEMVKPEWIPENGADPLPWDQRLDGNSVYAFGEPPGKLTRVVLHIHRGARRYKFTYHFSGVGLKYDGLYP
jgi:hypothetical protein